MRMLWRSPLPGQASIIHFLRVHVTMQIWALLNSPTGLCLSLFLPHSPCSASIQTMNGQGSNYSPHLSDQIRLENEENPRQAQSFLCCVLRGRGHPALSSREYCPLLVSWPFWKTGALAFGDPLLGLSHCVWPLHMLINLPDDALSIREPLFSLSCWWPIRVAESFACCFLTLRWGALCVRQCFPTLVSLHMTDGLLILPGQPEFDVAKVEVAT